MCKERALNRLGYTEEWLSSGIISEEFLMFQYEEINSSEDQNAEHYRCGGFRYFLNSKEMLTEHEIEAIFSLKDNGPDNCDLHENRIIELIYSGILTDEQLEFIVKFPEVRKMPIQKRYLREKLIRRVNRTSVEDCFEEIKNSEDSATQEYILEREDLLPKHAVWLAENGKNKRIRNVAKQLCYNRKFMINE